MAYTNNKFYTTMKDNYKGCTDFPKIKWPP